jgi:hypothetical protein
MRQGARCELLRDILGHANIDVTQNNFAAGGVSEWMLDIVGGRDDRCQGESALVAGGGLTI